jgi:hypothetical protein
MDNGTGKNIKMYFSKGSDDPRIMKRMGLWNKITV